MASVFLTINQCLVCATDANMWPRMSDVTCSALIFHSIIYNRYRFGLLNSNFYHYSWTYTMTVVLTQKLISIPLYKLIHRLSLDVFYREKKKKDLNSCYINMIPHTAIQQNYNWKVFVKERFRIQCKNRDTYTKFSKYFFFNEWWKCLIGIHFLRNWEDFLIFVWEYSLLWYFVK